MECYEKRALGADFKVKNESIDSKKIELPLIFYKGYLAKAVESGEALRIELGSNYEVSVSIPGGYSGEVSVGFVSPVYWRISELISLAVWVGFLLWRRKCGGKSPCQI